MAFKGTAAAAAAGGGGENHVCRLLGVIRRERKLKIFKKKNRSLRTCYAATNGRSQSWTERGDANVRYILRYAIRIGRVTRRFAFSRRRI